MARAAAQCSIVSYFSPRGYVRTLGKILQDTARGAAKAVQAGLTS